MELRKMKRHKKKIILALLSSLVITSFATSAYATNNAGNRQENIGRETVQTGWVNQNSIWYYYVPETGVKQTGWLKDGGTWYYLDGNGAMRTGWLHLNGSWYFLNGNGAMAEGWAIVGGTWYYFVPGNGAMVGPGWYLINNSW